MISLVRILGLWRKRFLWLLGGALVALAALASWIGLMVASGTMFAAGAVLLVPWLRGLGAGRVALRYLERLATHAAMFRALADLRVWFFRGLARGSAGGLGFRRGGDVLSRLVGDVEALDGLYLRILLPLVAAFFLAPVLALLIGWHSVLLAFVIVALFLLAALALPWFAARASLAGGVRLAEAAAGLRIAALDALTGRREVRAFGAEGRMLTIVQGREAALLAAQHAISTRTALAGAGAFLCAQAAILSVLIAAGFSPAAALPAAFLVLAAFEAVGGLPRAGALAGHAAAAAARVLEAAETPPLVPDPMPAAAPPKGFALRFEGVHFAWEPDRPPVFTGLSLDVPEGTRVALLGPSGAGKSTLAALALKVVAPNAGKITLDGVDIEKLAAADMRARIGWLSQATHLFDDTVKNNLLLARPDADDAALWAALEAARIADLVRALPDGLDTWVGEGGARFSGGQGRRLALARVLLSEAPILILDEPCTGLDAETERDFFLTLNEAASGRSIILIAHRLTGVERLDRIFRIAGGHAVVAAG
jgi:ATP-binding cassette subfamily C protein CydC